jgi:Protein of unknown function (DUF726)
LQQVLCLRSLAGLVSNIHILHLNLIRLCSIGLTGNVFFPFSRRTIAAPGIAAGIAAIAGTTAVAAAAATLATTAAVTAIFGVGGGGLVAYKMQRRTIGLTEFEFCKEFSAEQMAKQLLEMTELTAPTQEEEIPDVELFSTICISGWLRDDCDFQRPWGLSPSRPKIEDRLELLERFYSVYRPGHVLHCAKVLENWKGDEDELWRLLQYKYGRDPAHIFPLVDGPSYRGALSLEEKEVVSQLLGLGIPSAEPFAGKRSRQQTPLERMRFGDKWHGESSSLPSLDPQMDELTTFSLANDSASNGGSQESESEVPKLKHLATVWDYRAMYGGELYTVRWESALLEELCNSVTELAAGVVTGATAHLLKFTALSTLLSAVALPAALKTAADLIDGTWTLVVERADEAGRELAQSLLFSSAGNRPVTLVGFSFGARVIYCCLKELARLQEEWEQYHGCGDGADSKSKSRVVAPRKDAYFEDIREPASIVGDVRLVETVRRVPLYQLSDSPLGLL